MTTTQDPAASTVPDHPHVPACEFHGCRVCEDCAKVHHGGADTCTGCWIERRYPTATQ